MKPLTRSARTANSKRNSLLRCALFATLFLASACSSKPPAPEPEIYPCYKAKTFTEYRKLVAKRAKAPTAPLVIAGQKYACVESALEVQVNCYVAKTKKEFNKLSRIQEKQPDWPLKAGGKYYRCIQKLN
ncbi:MAG: hypothetical protein ACXVB9_08290 [Bdellovibrionota bacterium]